MDVVSGAPVQAAPETPSGRGSSWRSRLGGAGGPYPVLTAVVLALATVVPLVVLVKVASTGAFVRPISDDYCQVAWVKANGFWGLVQHYWELNGRVGNGLIATLVHRLPGDIRVLPALVAVAAVAATAALVARVLRVNGWAVPRLAVAAAAVAISCALVVREGSNFYQTFLWTPGNVTHTLPWVLAVALAALAVGTRSRVARVLVWPALVLGGLLLGTLTEILSALICALLVLLVIARLWHRRRLGRHDALALFGAAWVGAGVLVLLSSPGLANRRGAVSPLDPKVLREALRIWPEVLQHSVVRAWIVVPLAAGLLLGVLARPASRDRVPYRALLGWSALALLISLVGGSLLTVDADTTGFGPRGAMNYPRTWLDFMAATAFCLMLLAVVAGRALAERVAAEREPAAGEHPAEQSRAAPARAGVLALVAVGASIAVVAVGAGQYARVSTMDRTVRERASAWDAQASSIRAQGAAGARSVVYRPVPMGTLSEPFGPTGRATFARGCAETYFGVPLLPPPRPKK